MKTLIMFAMLSACATPYDGVDASTGEEVQYIEPVASEADQPIDPDRPETNGVCVPQVQCYQYICQHVLDPATDPYGGVFSCTVRNSDLQCQVACGDSNAFCPEPMWEPRACLDACDIIWPFRSVGWRECHFNCFDNATVPCQSTTVTTNPDGGNGGEQ